jgi:hypothetical protein
MTTDEGEAVEDAVGWVELPNVTVIERQRMRSWRLGSESNPLSKCLLIVPFPVASARTASLLI